MLWRVSADDAKLQEYGALHVNVLKTQQKKETYTIQAEISVEQLENNITEVVLFNPTKLGSISWWKQNHRNTRFGKE